MTREEWLKIGYQNGIVELEESEKMTFEDGYRQWFVARCKVNRGSTMDRVEATWNKHYAGSPLADMDVSDITERDIIQFFQSAVLKNGSVSRKEFDRMYQLVHGVLQYLRDMGTKGVRLYDWPAIKRNAPQSRIVTEKKVESALSKTAISAILNGVVKDNIYPQKRSACLCLCLNFYLGLRVGELAALKFTDFDIGRKVVVIRHSEVRHYERDEEGNRTGFSYHTADTKTVNSHREIPLLPEAVKLYELIENHHKISGYNSAFLVFDGTDSVRIRSLDNALRRLCSLAGIAPFNSHAIRKTFASMLHHANVPTKAISELMGHAEIRTTEKSYILSFEDSLDMYYQYMQSGLVYN